MNVDILWLKCCFNKQVVNTRVKIVENAFKSPLKAVKL